jgi:hypothetical protein
MGISMLHYNEGAPMSQKPDNAIVFPDSKTPIILNKDIRIINLTTKKVQINYSLN